MPEHKDDSDKTDSLQPTTGNQDKARMWSERYNTAKTYQEPMFRKWAKWYDDMYAHIHNEHMALWRSKVYMPIIASKVWDLISRFIQYRPGWEVSVRSLPVHTLDREAFNLYMKVMEERAEKVKLKLDYDYDNPHLEDTLQDEMLAVMLDAAVTGQGVGRVPYLNKKTEYKQHPAIGDSVDLGQEEVMEADEGYNGFQAVNIFNFFITPGAKSLQKAPWVIVHDFVPLAELKQDPKYKNLDKVSAGKVTNEFATYEASRNRLVQTEDTVSLDDSIDMVEIFECHDKYTGEVCTYAVGNTTGEGNWVEIYYGENIYWHKKYPLVPFYIRRKPYQFWGESLFENSETLQAAVNDIFNHYMDNYNMQDGMIAIEEGSVVEPYIVEPGGEIRYRGEQPKQFKFPQPDAAGTQTAINLVQSAIENATISQYASGIPNSQTDNTAGTATGVTRMMEAAAEKVGFMRSNFRRAWREVGYMWLSNTQQFMSTDIVTERTEYGEKKPEVVRPTDVTGMFGVKIDDGSFEPVSKDELRQNFLELVANLQQWQAASVQQAERTQDPNDALRIDWGQVMLRGTEHFGETASHFIMPPPPEPEPEMAPPELDAGMDPAGMIEGELAPLPAEEAFAEPMMDDDPFAYQPDGKRMPESFPIRSVNNLGDML